MGKDIHVYLAKHNYETGKNDFIKLYDKNYKYVSVYDRRNYELFEKLTDCDFPTIHPDLMDDELKEIYYQAFPKNKEYTGYFDPEETTLADIKNIVLKHPKKYKILSHFIKRIKNYCIFATENYLFALDSDIKIYYWFDN